ncbi:MAG: alpha/beta hydrolase [Proteobacteria bacterium]|nr:alpha/beta hydrolase [Pseudomonadota bacterium]
MPSPQHEAIVQAMAGQSSPGLGSVEEARAGMEAMTATAPIPDGASIESVDAGGVPALAISTPGADPERVVLYLHGGGYVIGSAKTHRSLVARISRDAGVRCVSLDYRLAPEHPFPAAVDDALAAYRHLLASGVEPSRLVVAGDSAGGGLTLATLLALRDAGDPLPAAGVCYSPWTDLEGTGPSATDPATDDPMVELEPLREMGRRYYGASDPRHPLAAPLYGDFTGLPPLLIFVGTRELLLDDATRVADKARGAGVDVTLHVETGLIHVWPFLGDDVPEAAKALAQTAEFIQKHAG